MTELLAFSGLVSFVIGLVLLIVFLVMAVNVGTIVTLLRKQLLQNYAVIKLLQGDKLSDEEIELLNEKKITYRNYLERNKKS